MFALLLSHVSLSFLKVTRPFFSFLIFFIFLVIAILLGLLMDQLRLGKVGWSIMVGWLLWVVLLPLFIEVMSLFLSKKSGKLI